MRKSNKRHYRSWGGGKGDADRTANKEAYRLGMELIRIAEKHGKDSEEYRTTLKRWREAQ